MGSSHSDDSRSRLQRHKLQNQNTIMKKKLSTQYRKSHVKKDIKIKVKLLSFFTLNFQKKWRQIFTEIMASESLQDLQYWREVQTALEAYISEIKEQQDMELFVTKKSTNMTLPTFYGSNVSVPNESYIINPEKSSKGKITSFKLSLSDSSEIESSSILPRQPNEYKSVTVSNLSPLFKPKENFNQSLQEKPQSKAESKEMFKKKIESQNYFVLGLINTFKSTWKEIYQKQSQGLQQDSFTAQHGELYSNFVNLIKCFVAIFTNFLSQIYEGEITQLEACLEQEDINPLYFIESVIYKLIFEKNDSNLKDELFKLLSLKYAPEVQKFKQVIEKRKHEKLESYDHEVLQNSREYLLESAPVPYIEVSKTMKTLNRYSSPYSKYELINIILEEEMWNCIYDTYKGHNNSIGLLNTLKQSFGMEIRLPIMLYCIVQSQCEELVIVRRFIEEFIDPQTLDSSIGYTTFQGCIDYLIKDEDYVSLGMKTSRRASKVSPNPKRDSAVL